MAHLFSLLHRLTKVCIQAEAGKHFNFITVLEWGLKFVAGVYYGNDVFCLFSSVYFISKVNGKWQICHLDMILNVYIKMRCHLFGKWRSISHQNKPSR